VIEISIRSNRIIKKT